MSETWARVALVLGALAVAGLVVLFQRWRLRRPVREVESGTLSGGVYFFSSASCPTCAVARRKLEARLGASGYTEYAWEEEPGPFSDLGVDAVPAVAILDDDGRGRLYPGQPGRALARL